MLKTIVGIIVVIWLLGFLFRVAGDVIHVLLVIALVVLILDFMGIGRKSAA